MTFDAYITLKALGSLQGFLLVVLFAQNPRFNRKSNNFLALLLFVISLSLLNNVLMSAGITNLVPWFGNLPMDWEFLIPVSLYYFIQFLLNPDYRFQKWEYILFVPALIDPLLASLLMFSFSDSPEIVNEWGGLFDSCLGALDFLKVMYLLVFLIIILRNLKKAETSETPRISLASVRWLKRIMLITFVLWTLWALAVTYQTFGGYDLILSRSISALFIGLVTVIYWVGYSAYLRKDIFEMQGEDEPRGAGNAELSEKTDVHFERLLQLMEQEHLYRNPDLNMSLLSGKLALSNGYLSQIINQKEGRNFFDFVNRYRVEEVKKRLADTESQHLSILGIAMEAGFKSKSTFNAAFKKHTGMTPSAYKKQLPDSSESLH